MIEKRDRNKVGEAVIRVLLGENERLVAFLSAADDAVGDFENIECPNSGTLGGRTPA
jgi:hypothetical protein